MRHQCLEATNFPAQPPSCCYGNKAQTDAHTCPRQERWVLTSPCSRDADVSCPSRVVTVITTATVRMCYFSHLILTTTQMGANYGHPLFS